MARRLTLAAVLFLGCAVEPALARTLVPLCRFQSSSRGDSFTTSDPRWIGRVGERRSPDYELVRVEGMVLSPDAPQPPGTQPLVNWWSEERRENFLTTDLRWRGRVGDVRSGYVLTRVEGYVYEQPVAGTVALRGYWNGTRRDNLATTDGELRPGYSGGAVLGYIDRAAREDLTNAFGFGSMRVHDRLAAGERPLFLILIEFRDRSFSTGRGQTAQERTFWGPSYPNIRDYFREVSGGAFTWRPAGVFGPHIPQNDPATPQDESTFSGGVVDEVVPVAIRALESAANRGFIRMSALDADRDGTIRGDELGVVVVVADGGTGMAHVRPERPVRIGFAGGAMELQLAIFSEGATFATRTHELTHLLGAYDVYGSGAHSAGLSLMSDTAGGNDDRRTWYLDPWHRMVLGWLQPRVFEIGSGGHVLRVAAPQAASAPAEERRPLLLFHPVAGMHEYFLIEYRNALGSGNYDSDMRDWRGQSRGIAVWQVKTDDRHQPVLLNGIVIQDPGRPPGRLDSVPVGDDMAQDSDRNGVNDTIIPGLDRELQSRPAGNDVYAQDRAMFVLGAPNAQRGTSKLLTDGAMTVRWLPSPRSLLGDATTISVDPTSLSSATAVVEWGTPFAPRLDSVRRSFDDTSVRIAGAFPVPRLAAYRVEVIDGDFHTWTLPVTRWTASSVEAALPATLPAGTYSLQVVASVDGNQRSNWVALAIPDTNTLPGLRRVPWPGGGGMD
jgi:M6 family metalloprotease-like protein